MKFKKTLCLLLCLTMSAGMAGCGSPEASDVAGHGSPEVSVVTGEQKPQTTESTTLPQQEAEEYGVGGCEPVDADLLLEEYIADYMDFNTYFLDFEWKSENYDALADYIGLLCTEYDFEQSGETYYEHIWDTAFFDMVLRYTGEKSVEGGYAVGTHSENVGDLQIFGKIDKYGQLNCNFQCDPALQGGDDGYRYGQTERVNQPGTSMELGLLSYYDSIFETTDGRLSTKRNYACILTDGQLTDYPARYEIDLDQKRLVVYVENEYGDAMQCFYVPTLDGWRTEVYPVSEFVIDRDYAVMSRGIDDSLPTKTWSKMFATVHNGQYVYPVTGLSGEMNGLEFRVMYQGEDVIVFYTRATFRSEPNIVEALIAVSTDVEPVSEKEQASSVGSGSEKCGSCSGSGNCRTCGGSGYKYVFGEEKACGSCGSTGNCGYCGGTGKK